MLYSDSGNITYCVTRSLTPSSFWILTALAGQRRHGYEILQEATTASEGRASVKVTTLYAALERLEREGLIRSDGEEVVNGRARRYYVLTDEGAVALTQEVEALEAQAAVARSRLTALTRPIAGPKAVMG